MNIKYLLLILLVLLNGCSRKNYESEQRRRDEILINQYDLFKDFSCFEFGYIVKANESWEKTHFEISLIYMLIKKSKTGFLIAQPLESEGDKRLHSYWIRSVEKNDFWLSINGSPRPIKCPNYLTKKKILKLIETNYKDSIESRNLK